MEEKNKTEDQMIHDPVAAGKKAIEAEKVADSKGSSQNESEDKKDAEKWRNEG